MRATLLGTGFSIPFPGRAQSGVLVETEENLILLDCGSGVLERISRSGYHHTKISHVFFTHHHLDHDMDFLALLKANYLLGRKDMKVFGPEGNEEWVASLLGAYPYLRDRFEMEVEELQDGDVITIEKDIIEVRGVAHILPSLAYRIDSGGSSLVYSGDTEPCEGVRLLCERGVDVLIHECSSLESYEGHTSPKELGEFAETLPVKRLVLTHFSPEVEDHLPEIAEMVAESFHGEIILGYDLLKLEV